MFRIFILIMFFAAFSGCTTSKANLYELPSGKKVKLTSINQMSFPKGDSGLVMNYETDIPIENKTELRGEVDEIWSVFQKDVEAANLKAAAIRAVHNETSGIISRGSGYGFVFEKRSDGLWHCLDDD